MIDWDPIEINPDDCCLSLCERGHYYRFLYRAYKFALNYPSWVRLSHPISDRFINELPNWVLNFPTREASESKKTNLSAEAHLERELVSMMESYFDVSDHQFPVGLFYKEVGRKYARTSGNGSQIDLWGEKKSSGSDYTLSVFELKNQSNKEVGIISELLFYTNVMSDFVSGVFKYPSSFDNKRMYYRHCKELYDLVRSGMIKEINGVLLADYLHPLITPKVIDILKSNKNGVCYSWMTVEDFKKKMNGC